MKKQVILLGLAMWASCVYGRQNGVQVAGAGQPVEGEMVRASQLIDGLFFTERPEPLPVGQLEIGFVKDSLGNKVAVTVYPEGKRLSAEAVELAIPVERVFCGEELLQAVQDARMISVVIPAPSELRYGVGDTLPAFSEVDDRGRRWTEKDAAGRPLVLNFWYTGCRPCIREMPELNLWMEACPDALCLSVTWNTAEEIRPIVERQGFAFHRIVNARQLWDAFGIRETPATVVVDRKGVIRRIEIGTSILQRRRLLECLKEAEAERSLYTD